MGVFGVLSPPPTIAEVVIVEVVVVVADELSIVVEAVSMVIVEGTEGGT